MWSHICNIVSAAVLSMEHHDICRHTCPQSASGHWWEYVSEYLDATYSKHWVRFKSIIPHPLKFGHHFDAAYWECMNRRMHGVLTHKVICGEKTNSFDCYESIISSVHKITQSHKPPAVCVAIFVPLIITLHLVLLETEYSNTETSHFSGWNLSFCRCFQEELCLYAVKNIHSSLFRILMVSVGSVGSHT